MRIGLIADTHGLLRPEAVHALHGCAHILHAGDIGRPEVLEQLATLAPVTAIRGNNDTAPWARSLPETCVARFGDVAIYLLHDLKDLARHPSRERVDVILAGHSHRPHVETRDGVLIVNPGSAGPRRFRLPVSVGYLDIEGCAVRASIVELEVAASRDAK